MRKSIFQIVAFVMLFQLSCQVRKDNSKPLDMQKLFTNKTLSEWNRSTREYINEQIKLCDTTSHAGDLLKRALLVFNSDEKDAEIKNSLRSSFIVYLVTSELMKDTRQYNSLYIVESFFSGEQQLLLNYIVIIEGEKSKLYRFNYAHNEWQFDTAWMVEGDKLENLFPKLSCSPSNCETATLGTNKSLTISKVAPNRIASKVIVNICKEDIIELSKFLKVNFTHFNQMSVKLQ